MRPLRASAAALLLLAAACAPRAATYEPAPAASITRTAPGEAEVAALAELLRLEDERVLDSARIAALIRHPHPEVRARAALAAGRLHDIRAAELLRTAAADAESDVRASAIFALGLLADTSASTVSVLSAALARSDSAGIEAPGALARLNTPAAFAALDAHLQSLATGRAQRAASATARAREGLLALSRFTIRPGTLRPGAAETALRFLADRDADVRWAAAYAFARSAPPAAAIPALLPLLRDTDALVRATAARALRPVQVDSAGQRAAARAQLASALADPHPHVRINAARALAAFRTAEDVAAIAALTRDADGNVRIAAAEALANVPGTAAALLAIANDEQAALSLRNAALGSLVRADSAAALRTATTWTNAGSWVQRLYAARTLGAINWPAPDSALRRLARDPDPRVQGEAYGALAAADSTAPLGHFLLEGLASPDPLVRAAAASGLGRRADPSFLSALMQAYDRAQRDGINDAALAALDALQRLARADVPVAQSFFLRFQPARDPIVRARVAQHFGTANGSWGDPRPTRAGRDLAFYQNAVRTLMLPALQSGAEPRVRIRTARGDIVLALAAAEAPLTVHNFLDLVRSGFYRVPDLRWHRVVPNFVLQDGDPRGDGSGGPDRVIRDEINALRYRRGVLGMALSGPDTGGSQYFITHSPQPHLDGGYTIFGRVVEGMDVADAIVQDDAILAIEVVQ